MTSSKKLTEGAWMALEEALCTYHWYKRPFETLVRSLFAQAPDALAAVNFGETKRIAVDHLMRALRRYEHRYQVVVIDALVALSDVNPKFPHLARIQDRPSLVDEAKAARRAVRLVIEQYSELTAEREVLIREAEERAERETALRQHESRLGQLRDQFLRMQCSSDEPQKRGYEFEGFLNALFELWDLDPRASYRIEHEQIDGAFTFRTDDYILEARWSADPLDPEDLGYFKVKVDAKARNTLGLCISIGGFTEGAIKQHTGSQTPLVLMDGADLMPVLEGLIALTEVLHRKRRHAAETGNPMYRAWQGSTRQSPTRS